jgi:hypothetical protein
VGNGQRAHQAKPWLAEVEHQQEERMDQQASHRGLAGLGANCTLVMLAPARTALPACWQIVSGPSAQEAAMAGGHRVD